jgi:hypothetical protein
VVGEVEVLLKIYIYKVYLERGVGVLVPTIMDTLAQMSLNMLCHIPAVEVVEAEQSLEINIQGTQEQATNKLQVLVDTVVQVLC